MTMNPPPDEPSPALAFDLTAALTRKYGLLMSASEVAMELKFTTPDALRMAVNRGAIALQPLKIPKKRGPLYVTVDVARLLASWLDPDGATRMP